MKRSLEGGRGSAIHEGPTEIGKQGMRVCWALRSRGPPFPVGSQILEAEGNGKDQVKEKRMTLSAA